MAGRDSFRPVFVGGRPDRPALLLLHGTGGDESDLIPLGQAIAPGWSLLSVRGKVLENGMPRFFRRLAEGIFDQEDLVFRTNELADFIVEAKTHYKLGERKVFALGFSNGANIAASTLLLRPEVLDGAVLLRAMVPFQPRKRPDLSGKNVLMIAGLMDPIVPIENAKTLAGILQDAGAAVTFMAKPASHNLSASEPNEIERWLAAELNS